MASPDERRLFEQFVVAGLPSEGAEPLRTTAQECGQRNSQPLAPITDVCVVFPSLGETVPNGFEMLASTPLGYPADLNHGSFRQNSAFICYRRGYHKPPLVDIGILDHSRGEKPMPDSNTVMTTPFGRVANVNNASDGIFLTYRRATPNSAPSLLVVTQICVILANKGEIPPHTYYKITKNLNRGMVGSDVYICYKKSQGSSKRLAYKPVVLDSFPKNASSSSLAQNVPMFCLPMGALIECWPAKCQHPDKTFSTFVLTDENGTKFYGASVTFYEQYKGELSTDQLDELELLDSETSEEGGAVEDNTSTNDPAENMKFYRNAAICLVSRYPFFSAFKRFLYHLHRMSVDGLHSVPIERFISHLMYEVSFPCPRRPRVLCQLGAETVSFDSPDDSQLPLSGSQVFDALKCLGADNLMYLMLLAMLEQKILVHSLRPWLLTAVAESVCALMFPFHWQCPYVPQCPLGLAGVLHAPLPFIAGVDSRYFELYEDPPDDVTCFDLDTSTISASKARHTCKLSMLPKRATRQLRNSLEQLYRELQTQDFRVTEQMQSGGFVPVDKEVLIQKKRRTIEMGVHDAFLRFIASLMRGYSAFLRPITSAPSSAEATDTARLFDKEAFLRSRDKAAGEFFRRFAETQSFNRFIEERSFISDKNAYNAFFDECIDKAEQDDHPLLELESSLSSDHTVFIAPPEPIQGEGGEERSFRYPDGFPRVLDEQLYQLDRLNIRMGDQAAQIPVEHAASRCAAIRTQPETRSSLRAASASVKADPLRWPRTLLFYAYSLWFMQLPSLIAISTNKRKTLRLAFHVLLRLERTEVLPLDQVCFRILIEMCGRAGEPALAVRVLQAMRRLGVEQNAVTYGIYHRAVMDAEWPSETRQSAQRAWHKLRLVLTTITIFRNDRRFERRVTAWPDGNQPDEQRSGSTGDISTDAYTISYHPLSGEGEAGGEGEGESDPLRATPSPTPAAVDPLGASEMDAAAFRTPIQDRVRGNSIPKAATASSVMSPSRARFLAEHDAQPFADELPKKEKGGGGGWFKGITNSPVFRMIKSSTFEGSLSSVDRKDEAMASPSLSGLVKQVRKGYDNVLKTETSSRLRLGVSSMIEEVRNMNRSYGAMGSGSLFEEESTENLRLEIDDDDPAYQLNTGETGSILGEAWWLSGQCLLGEDEEGQSERGDGTYMEVTLSTCTACPHCETIIYDEEIMAGWKVDDQNLNTECPFCAAEMAAAAAAQAKTASMEGVGKRQARASGGEKPAFAPRLTVEFRRRGRPVPSWYAKTGKDEKEEVKQDDKGDGEVPDPMSYALLSPLVLRRELETLVAADLTCLKDRSLMKSHPILFWNLVYYMRRLALPSHMYSWISPRHHIRCVYDRPHLHPVGNHPLYFLNPANTWVPDERKIRHVSVWQTVTNAIQESKPFTAIQSLVNESRRVTDGGVVLTTHVPIFRDIQFASLDVFGRSLMRDALERMYALEFEKLPPRILPLLPAHDRPPALVHRACRMVFLPLDLY